MSAAIGSIGYVVAVPQRPFQPDQNFDPLRLHGWRVSLPTDGELPPAICLVEDDGPFPSTSPTWLRVFTAGMVATFATATIVGIGWLLQDGARAERVGEATP
jgi:hypothetical protein